MRGWKYANDPEYQYYRKSEADILEGWKRLGEDACSRGSFFHISAEYHCNNIHANDESPEFLQYLAFRASHPHLIPYRTEMLIFDEAYRIVGSVDAIFHNLHTNKYLIVDWKRSKKVTGKGGDVGFWPIDHLRSNNLTKYSIQQVVVFGVARLCYTNALLRRCRLSLYTYILEQNYGLDMEESALVVCHPNQDTYNMIRTKYLRDDVEMMLNYRLLCMYKQGIIPMPLDIAQNESIAWELIRCL